MYSLSVSVSPRTLKKGSGSAECSKAPQAKGSGGHVPQKNVEL